MKLEKNITIHESMLKAFVEYVNLGWDKNYTVEDVVGVEWGRTFLFVHFNEKDFHEEAYPVRFKLDFVIGM